MDLNHRPHAYQACALDQLSYRPGSLIPSDASTEAVSKNRSLGPWKLDGKRYLGMRFAFLESASLGSRELGADLGLVA